MFLGWPPIITLNNIYVAVNIYIYKLVTPEFICLLEWGVSVHQGLTDSFSFTFPSFFHIPWLTVNSLCLLFLMLLTLWTPYLCFHGLPLQINFFKWKYEVVVNLTKCFQTKKCPQPLPNTHASCKDGSNMGTKNSDHVSLVLFPCHAGHSLYVRVSQPQHYWHLGPNNLRCEVFPVHWGCLTASLPSTH